MSEQLATVEPPAALAPIASKSRAIAMRAQMEAESEVRKLLAEYVERHMVRDTDYGVIPGTNKPTLLKPGAEKLVDLYRCEPRYEITHRLEDWDRGLFKYEFRCKLVDEAGRVLAEGFGSANSREGRYRWRNGERKCPVCGLATIIKGKAEYGGGWVCFKKKGGCGEKFADAAPEIIDQQVGKVENDDIATLDNTILKMAKKRALVDGAIALARCSDLFTQDVEDLGPHHDEEPTNPPQRQERSAGRTTRAPKSTAAPAFGAKLAWAGREQWAGKPLTSAGLDTLLAYEQAVIAAVAAPENPKHLDALKAHQRDVELAITLAEKPYEPDPDPTNGDDTAGMADPGSP